MPEIPVCEVQCGSDRWMIDVGRAAAHQTKVLVTHFEPTSSNIGFLRSVALQNRMSITFAGSNVALEPNPAA